jgi:hypothetical protein
MSLEYAADHLEAAVRSLATGDAPLAQRLQTVWDEQVQMIWTKPCLTRDLLRRFKAWWEACTAPSDDPRSTTLRDLGRDETIGAVDGLLALWKGVIEARASGDPALATLADLTP